MPRGQQALLLHRRLGVILRHQPRRYGVDVAADGFAQIAQVVSALQRQWPAVTIATLNDLVAADTRGRYERRGTEIRATYGHSISVQVNLEAITPPTHLYYAAAPKQVGQILAQGLRCHGRRQVQLSRSPFEAYRSGRRKSMVPVLLTVRAEEAVRAGHHFCGAGSTVMTDRVDAHWIAEDLVAYLRTGTHVVLSGAPGIGKTTTIRRALSQLHGVNCAGFYTDEIRGMDGARTGFRVHTLDGQQGVLADIGRPTGPQVGMYGVNVDVIEQVINPAIARALTTADVLIVDEIGKMEVLSKQFQQLIRQACASAVRLIGTAPSYHVPFVDALKQRRNVVVADISVANRDAWAAALVTGLHGATPA